MKSMGLESLQLCAVVVILVAFTVVHKTVAGSLGKSRSEIDADVLFMHLFACTVLNHVAFNLSFILRIRHSLMI